MKNNLLFMQRSLMVFVLLLFCTISAHAQDWNQIIKATAGDRNKMTDNRSGSFYYGSAVTISGNYAMVATQEDNGPIYVLRNDNGNWTQIKILTCPEPEGWGSLGDFNRSGGSVALSGDYAVVGAPLTNEDSTESNDLVKAGAAYILKKDQGGLDNWGVVKKITASNPMVGDLFGYSVAISGDYVVVGASKEDEDELGANNIYDAGSAFVFKKDQGGLDNWGEVKKITADIRAVADNFGSSVSIDGDYIIVGAPTQDGSAGYPLNNTSPGAAYIFGKDKGGPDKWGLVKAIVPSDGSREDYFGFSVAISGDYAVVGAWLEDHDEHGKNSQSAAGSSYIFKKDKNGTDNWGQLKKIVASDRKAINEFGYSVAIEGDYIVIGARYKTNAGACYIFSKDLGGVDKWGELRKVSIYDGSHENHLGSSVAISGNYILSGAPDSSTDLAGGNDMEQAGAAFFFQKDTGGTNNWGLAQKVVKMEVIPQDQFGYSVSISGNYAVVGVPNEDNDSSGSNYIPNSGAAYIFHNNSGTWQQVKKVTATRRVAYARFGFSVAIDGEYVIVGTPFETEESGNASGSAFLFRKDEGGTDNWGLVKRLLANARGVDDQFAYSVSISGDYAVIGAPLEDENALETNFIINAGSAYIFYKNQGGENNWGQLKKVTASVRASGDNFGMSVSISGNNFIVGAIFDSEDGSELNTLSGAGSAYIFTKDNGTNQWVLLKKIVNPFRVSYEQFGYAVSLDGDHAIVSAIEFNGSAIIFRKDQGGTNNWGFVQKLVPSGTVQESFGYSVSISGNNAVVGASAGTGSIYIYNKDFNGTDIWGQTQKITASVPTAGDQFGFGVAISGNSIIVGAPGDDEDEAEANPLSNAGSIYIFRNGSPLPVTLATFEASKSENTAILQWTTSAETNTDHFEILRSTDAKSWETLGYVEAANESTKLLSYTFTDHKPAAGENFYRLKMVDRAADRLDGTFTYSRIRNVSFDINGNITLYPNPVSERLFLTDTETDKIASVSIINVLGQTVLQVSEITKEGIAIHQLAAGMYLVQVRKKSGSVQMNKVLVAR